MGCLKGQSFLQANYYLQEKGYDNLRDVLKPLLSAEAWSALYDSPITPLTWIELAYIMEDWIAKDKYFGKGDWSFMTQVLSDITEHQFKGIYKILISVFSAERILKKTSGLWRRFYNTGELSVQNYKKGHAILRLENFPDIPRHHERLLFPYIQRLLELCGNKNIVLKHPKCIANGDPYCVTDLTWQ